MPKPDLQLDEDTLANIADALDEMENLSQFDASEAGVACDRLASALIDAFLAGKKNPFHGRAPELYEVLETLEETIKLPPAAAEAALEISTALEDAYDLQDNEDVAEEVKEFADVVSNELTKFLGIDDNGD